MTERVFLSTPVAVDNIAWTLKCVKQRTIDILEDERGANRTVLLV